jgi:hypothetical protein
MSEPWAIALAGFVVTILVGLVGVCFGFVVLLAQRVTKLESLIDRVDKMEEAIDTWIEGIGKKALSLLHSPNDHLGLDQLIEEYERRNFDLTNEQWDELKVIVTEVEGNPQATKNEILCARLARLFATHKLMRFTGKMEKV